MVLSVRCFPPPVPEM
uniref:Uncharacterized protein n=1 Tax=Anguilla anguilla TaxID=7936 RepID=A0A0E9T5W2_ANGAN